MADDTSSTLWPYVTAAVTPTTISGVDHTLIKQNGHDHDGDDHGWFVPIDSDTSITSPLPASTATLPALPSASIPIAAVASLPPGTKRAMACLQCYNRKVRCSGTRPCERCVKFNKHDQCCDRLLAPPGPRKPRTKKSPLATAAAVAAHVIDSRDAIIASLMPQQSIVTSSSNIPPVPRVVPIVADRGHDSSSLAFPPITLLSTVSIMVPMTPSPTTISPSSTSSQSSLSPPSSPPSLADVPDAGNRSPVNDRSPPPSIAADDDTVDCDTPVDGCVVDAAPAAAVLSIPTSILHPSPYAYHAPHTLRWISSTSSSSCTDVDADEKVTILNKRSASRSPVRKQPRMMRHSQAASAALASLLIVSPARGPRVWDPALVLRTSLNQIQHWIVRYLWTTQCLRPLTMCPVLAAEMATKSLTDSSSPDSSSSVSRASPSALLSSCYASPSVYEWLTMASKYPMKRSCFHCVPNKPCVTCANGYITVKMTPSSLAYPSCVPFTEAMFSEVFLSGFSQNYWHPSPTYNVSMGSAWDALPIAVLSLSSPMCVTEHKDPAETMEYQRKLLMNLTTQSIMQDMMTARNHPQPPRGGDDEYHAKGSSASSSTVGNTIMDHFPIMYERDADTGQMLTSLKNKSHMVVSMTNETERLTGYSRAEMLNNLSTLGWRVDLGLMPSVKETSSMIQTIFRYLHHESISQCFNLHIVTKWLTVIKVTWVAKMMVANGYRTWLVYMVPTGTKPDAEHPWDPIWSS